VENTTEVCLRKNDETARKALREKSVRRRDRKKALKSLKCMKRAKESLEWEKGKCELVV
jgi:hypothetical protein